MVNTAMQEERLKKEEAKYDDAMSDLTSGKSLWKQVGLGFADVLTNTVLPTMAMAGGASMMAGAMSNLEAMGTAGLAAFA